MSASKAAATTIDCTLGTQFRPLHRHARSFSLSLSRRAFLNSITIASFDAFALALALLTASAFRISVFGSPVLPTWSWLFIPAWWIAAWLAGLLPGWGLSAADHLRRQVMLLSGLVGLAASVMFFAKASGSFSRISVGVAWGVALVLVPLGRVFARSFLGSLGMYGVPAVLFGRGKPVASVLDHLRLEGGLGYTPTAVCTDERITRVADLPVIGGLDHPTPAAPVAIVVSRGLSPQESSQVIHQALAAYSHVVILPDLDDIPSLWVTPRDMNGLLGIQVNQFLLNPLALASKRLIDLTATLVTSPFWAPLCAAIAILIWLEDRQTPIFKQARIGRGGRRFYAYKFRTMVVNAEQVLSKVLEKDPELRAEWEQNYKLRVDPRVTRVGRFLRRTSLDELPQLVNVFRGEMALVGPRPLPEYHHWELPDEVRELRNRTRPGMTGLWQVSGRSDTGNSGMARWDPYYVRNWSPWLDAVIVIRTIRVVLLGSGAY